MAQANDTSPVTWPFIEKLEVTRWAEFALSMIVFIFGVPGNLLILGVYRAKRTRTTTHVFIGALAMADLLTCVLRFADAVGLASVAHYLEFNHQSAVYFLSAGMLYTTALLATCIAFDRFDAVCRSLRRTLTLRRAKILATACFAVGFIGIIPEVGHKIYINVHDEEVDTFIRAILKFIPLVLYILSLVTITVLYCIIYVFMRKRREVLPSDMMPKRQNVSTTDTVGYRSDLTSAVDRGDCDNRIQQTLNTGSSLFVVPAIDSGAVACTSQTQQTPVSGGQRPAVTSRTHPVSQSMNQVNHEIHSASPSEIQQTPTVGSARAFFSPSQVEPAASSAQGSPTLQTNRPTPRGALAFTSDNRSGSPSVNGQTSAVISAETCSSEARETLADPNRRDDEGQSNIPHRPQNRHQRQSLAQARMTRMLLIATFMLFILWFPNVCLKSYALGSLFADFLKSSHYANVVAALLFLKDVAYFNSVVNVFIYGMANKRFRGDCKTVIQTLRKRFRCA